MRLAGIEGGIECARFAPLLSALADGEASAEDLAALRPHMKSCLSCRAALREFRAAPARVAALVPPAALAAADLGSGGGSLRSLVESVVGAAQHKAAALGERAHAAAELATGQKLAAVAASAAALAGGGTAVERLADQTTQRPPAAAEPQRQEPVKDEVAVETAPPAETTPPAAEAAGPARPRARARAGAAARPGAGAGDRVRPGGRRRGSATAPTRTRRAQRAAGRRPGTGRRRPGVGPERAGTFAEQLWGL